VVETKKLRMTKEARSRTFHLPVEQAVIVPSTSGVKTQRKISKSEMSERVRNVRRYLSDRFGGYTSVKAVGGWVQRKDKKDHGRLIKEKAVKVTAFAEKKDFNKHRPKVIKKIGSWGKKWKQESVSYEHEGDLYIISPPKNKRKITPIHRKKLLKNLVKARRQIKKRR